MHPFKNVYSNMVMLTNYCTTVKILCKVHEQSYATTILSEHNKIAVIVHKMLGYYTECCSRNNINIQ